MAMKEEEMYGQSAKEENAKQTQSNTTQRNSSTNPHGKRGLADPKCYHAVQDIQH